MEELTMKMLLGGATLAAIVALVLPAASQPIRCTGSRRRTRRVPAALRNRDCRGANPGRASHRLVWPCPKPRGPAQPATRAKVLGLPGNKSVPAERPSSLGRWPSGRLSHP